MNKTKSKNPVGRPTKYTDEYIENLADKLIAWFKKEDNFYIGQFASLHGMWRERLQEFANKNEYFSCAYKQAKQLQETRMVMGAMLGKYNTSMTIFTLKNVAGFRDDPAEAEDEALKDQELEFINVPHKNGKLPERFQRFLN